MRVALAGGESWSGLLLDMGVKNQLFSYYYFRNSIATGRGSTKALMARMRRAREKGYFFMLDSGAFTYHIRASSSASVPAPRKYYEEYLGFVRDYGDLFDVIVEFDVDQFIEDPETEELFETAKIDAWTQELMEVPGVAAKVMPVYHEHRGMAWFRRWLLDTRSPYVGMASTVTSGAASLIALTHRYGKFIHGFAQTRLQTDIKYTNYNSVDSTTWLRADRYGGTMIFRNNKMIILDHHHKRQRRLYKKWYEDWGLDFKKIMQDDLEENRKATIITWRELSNSFEQKAYIRTQGKGPYLWEAHRQGRVPRVHPLLVKLESPKLIVP